MKKFLLAVASLFVALTATASNVEKIQFANQGSFTLGAMVGIPHGGSANMPFLSLDGMVGVTDGFIHTKTFGDNGAIDVGAYVGYVHFGDTDEWYDGVVDLKLKERAWSLPIMARCGFHFEFVKGLDVSAGFQGGVAIQNYRWSFHRAGEKMANDADGDVDGIFGMYLNAKWYFTDVFGVKIEYSGDWIGDGHGGYAGTDHPGRGKVWISGHSVPYFSAGVTFNF